MVEQAQSINPAEEASKRTLEQVRGCLERGEHFLVEAGAGAGKTYSLVKALQFLIERHSTRCRDVINESHALPSQMSLRTKSKPVPIVATHPLQYDPRLLLVLD